MNICRSLLVSALIVAFFSSRAIAAEVLSELPANAQEDIKTICLPVQYQEGASAYRECVNNELNAYTDKALVPFDNLSLDDRYAIQQACKNSGARTSSSYQVCVRQQVAELNALPVPVIDDLSDDEQYALQQTCFDAQSRLGAGPYRQCVNRALRELRQLPVANFTGLSQVAQNGIQLRCSDNHQNVVDYRTCLLDAVGSVAAPTTAERTIVRQQLETTTGATTTTPAPTITSNTTANGDQITAVPTRSVTVLSSNQAVALTDTTKVATTATASSRNLDSDAEGSIDDTTSGETVSDSDLANAEDSAPVDPGGRVTNAWAQMKASFSALEGTNRIVVLSAVALPLLLLLGWALIRYRQTRRAEYEPVRSRSELLERIQPDFNNDEHEQLKIRLDAEADDFFGTINAEGIYDDDANASGDTDAVAAPDDRGSQPPDTSEVTEPVESRPYAAPVHERDDTLDRPQTASLSEPSATTRIATKPEIAAAAAMQKGLSDCADDTPASKAADRGTFATWLATVEPDNQLSYAIEFLIYWIAYGDERYDPALKEVLFQLQEPDDRDLIKRWVLKHDVIAFRDAIDWLQNNADSVQRRQIIDLLMVVLVNERALTPVQNTMLRFLGDAFGIGNAELDSQYREAYGAAMAPLPRVDKPKWWQRQHETASLRWDARAVADESLDVQYRIRLGLDLDGPVDEEAVVKGFRRAARRCHPERFDTLTERERELAEMQFEKFEDARDYLLGVDV